MCVKRLSHLWVFREFLSGKSVGLLVLGGLAVFAANGFLFLIPRQVSGLILRYPDYDPEALGRIVLLFFVYSGAGFFGNLLFGLVSSEAIVSVRKWVYATLLHAVIPFHDREESADLVTRLTSDAVFIHRALSAVLPVFAQNIPMLLIAVLLMISVDLPLALMILTGCAPPLLVPLWFGRRIRVLSRDSARLVGEMAMVAQESLTSIRAVKASGLESIFQDRLGKRLSHLLEMLKGRAFLGAAIEGLVPLCFLGSFLWFLWVAHHFLGSEGLPPGEFLTLTGYLALAGTSGFRLLRSWSEIESLRGAASRIARLRGMDILLESPSDDLPPAIDGSIAFEGVTFRYEASGNGLSSISFRIRPGEFVIVTGSNGAGKSTLVHLLLRFYEPQEGRILVGGLRSADVEPRAWRRMFGLVSREPAIFSGTIGENIGLARLSATAGDIEAVARTVGLHEFIAGLPKGYETQAGEGGVTLSSGQKQMIALARVLLRDPPIIILDEAVTSLDVHAEAALRRALEPLIGVRTILFGAHTSHLPWPADQVIKLEGGRIQSRGEDPPGRPTGDRSGLHRNRPGRTEL